MSYDALLLQSFGGPEAAEDVMPFLENVTRGRGVPHERLLEVAEHYHHMGGRSPINDQNRALKAALEAELDLPVYWGNRNWDPYVHDALRVMRDDGVRRALAFATSAYAGWSSCRQYREDIARARATVGAGAPVVEKLRHFFDHPGFVEVMAESTAQALERLEVAAPRVLFVAHSIPTRMADSAGPRGGAYVGQLEACASLVAERLPAGAHGGYELAWCSRSGPPSVPWLEPDVSDRVEQLARDGAPGIVLVPIGFVSDHMEVAYDLDVEAAERARSAGVPLTRAATAGTHPRFVAMVRELVEERTAAGPRLSLGPDPELSWDACGGAGCCGVDAAVGEPADRAALGRTRQRGHGGPDRRVPHGTVAASVDAHETGLPSARPGLQ